MMSENRETYRDQYIGALQEGDKDAFERMFREYYVGLCVYAEGYLRDRDMAQDVVQQVFCRVWEKQGVGIRESLKAYLYRSVYHAAINHLRQEKVKGAFLEYLQEQGMATEESGQWEEQEEYERLLQQLNQVIDALPEQCREIFQRSRFAGQKSAEIAVELGISVRTVETQLYRAMKKLREELLVDGKNSILLSFFFKIL